MKIIAYPKKQHFIKEWKFTSKLQRQPVKALSCSIVDVFLKNQKNNFYLGFMDIYLSKFQSSTLIKEENRRYFLICCLDHLLLRLFVVYHLLLRSFVAQIICCIDHLLHRSICCLDHLLLRSFVAQIICCLDHLLPRSFVAQINFLLRSFVAQLICCLDHLFLDHLLLRSICCLDHYCIDYLLLRLFVHFSPNFQLGLHAKCRMQAQSSYPFLTRLFL